MTNTGNPKPAHNPGATTHAVNKLIAAAVAHGEALRSGQGPSMQQEFRAAVDAYLAVRSDADAARDRYLIDNPAATSAQAATAFGKALTETFGIGLAWLSARKARRGN